MPYLRRSQRLCSKPQDQIGQQPETQRKRKNRDVTPVRDTNQPALKRFRLSEKNLKRHERAQKNQRNQQAMGKQRKSAGSSTSKTSTVTTTDKLFPARLSANRVVYQPFDTEAPVDAARLEEALLKVQDIPTWAHGQWERMKLIKREGGQSELSLESMIVESMLLQHGHDAPLNYNRFRNQQWTEVENEITAGISDPKPDVTEAYLWSAYPADTRNDFEELIVSQYSFAMPTFAMESKGPNASHEQAIQQAAYDGAIMTHAAIAVDGHVGKHDMRFRNTKAITVTLSPLDINVYANHAIEDPKGCAKLSYHQYLLLRVDYLKNEQEWNKAHMVLYNAQRIALGLANARIDDLNKHFQEEATKQLELKLKQETLRQQAQAETKEAMSQVRKDRMPTGNARSNTDPQRPISDYTSLFMKPSGAGLSKKSRQEP